MVVAEDHLGLFDRPPGRRQVAFSVALVALLLVALLLVLPVRHHPLPEVAPFIPVVASTVFIADLITATLLFGQAVVFRSRALTVLGATYVYSAALMIPFALTFPGAFSTDGLLSAGVNTTSWIAFMRRAMIPIAVLVYVYLKRHDLARNSRSDAAIPDLRVAIVAALGLALAVSLLATIGHDLLPPFYSNRSETYPVAVLYELVFFLVSAIAVAVLFRARRSSLDIWLLVAFSGGLAQSVLILTLHSRFTAGWYWLYIVNLLSHLVVMLVLIVESNRLYMKLALSTAAREREREARLMSLEAVAAAISHEAGQPLAAVVLNTTAGLSWLNRKPPDLPRAIGSFEAAQEAAQRSSAVIKSVRRMFAKGGGERREFNLNDLVRDTAKHLRRELASQRVRLQLDLDETLPLILGDRTQMQQVLANLLINAVEAVSAAAHGSRRIIIRSAQVNERGVLLEVSDSGCGIPVATMEKIFETFFTTKPTGAGLGLSLSRMIVREHGGEIWASHGPMGGATFHLELPASGVAAPNNRTRGHAGSVVDR